MFIEEWVVKMGQFKAYTHTTRTLSNHSDSLEFRSTKDFLGGQGDRIPATLLRAAHGENTKQVYFNQSYNF